VLRIWIAGTAKCFRSLDLRGAVPACRVRNLAVELYELGVIDIGTEASLDGFQICPVSVAGNLHAIGETPRQITHELDGGRATAVADAPRWDQFGFRIDRNPRPDIAGILWRLLRERDVALLGVAKGPNLIELKALTGQVAERLILIS
jgi:hypothetical protein